MDCFFRVVWANFIHFWRNSVHWKRKPAKPLLDQIKRHYVNYFFRPNGFVYFVCRNIISSFNIKRNIWKMPDSWHRNVKLTTSKAFSTDFHPIAPLDNCACDLFVVILKHTRMKNWSLWSPSMGKSSLPGSHGTRKSISSISLLLSVAIHRKKTLSVVNLTMYLVPFTWPCFDWGYSSNITKFPLFI